MLSHLRFHKRDRSNPASPIPPDNTHNPWGDLQPAQLVPDDAIPSPDVRPRSSQSVPFGPHSQAVPPHPQQPPPQPPKPSHAPAQQAPILPPITRVVSDASGFGMDFADLSIRQRDEPRPSPVSPNNETSGFIGGLALRNLRLEQEASMRAAQKSPDVGPGSALSPSGFSSRPPAPPFQPVKAASSFISPTDMYKPGATGKRPPGARMASEPQVLPSQGYAPQEPPRGKKGLPFLKNPVSTLLLRRKTSQNAPDLSIQLRKQEPVYDPRIRGTRVHDFSAPRPRRAQPSTDALSPEAASSTDALGISTLTSPADMQSPIPSTTSPAVEVAPLPELIDDEKPSPEKISELHPALRRQLKTDETEDVGGAPMRAKGPGMSSRRKRGSVPPTISPLSRNASGHSFSAIPKHMKSTSSRFSFDMIGSANEEKLLEERHRQKQQDKQDAGDDAHGGGFRDSRFDDFDEDAFDYDNMDYDDGLEERIPGVNADYEEDDGFGGMDDVGYEEDDMGFDQDEQDPDNDQNNFGGFVFQRSDPNSLVASPLGSGPLLTPRDDGGNVIGYASAGSTPTYPPKVVTEVDSKVDSVEEDLVPMPLRHSQQMGLGIHGSSSVDKSQFEDIDLCEKPHEDADPAPTRHLDPDDELYFKSDDFSGEGDGNAFDESLFDLDDTDQYGRPIPGMFANALAQRNSGAADANKLDSGIASRLSAVSGASQSTAHTSVSVEPREVVPVAELAEKDVEKDPVMAGQLQQRPEASAEEKQQMAAYQAALAAAACQAAASGKFDRDSPPSPVDLMRQPSAAASSVYSTEDNILNSIEDYEADDDAYADLDDYELDDDAIIAEANASALANDSDGWYGQEFGFYAAPAQQQHLIQQQKSSKSLTEQNLYQYSHGGFFGPSGGLDRTMSGHAVLREPNLTPITERSEYSNRNSIMSLGIPPGIGSAPIQSPGLAQLAMMADDDDMSISALLKLRSKAWGGSQVSLSSREGSPNDRNGASSPWSPEPSSSFLNMTSPAGRKNSAFSVWSQDSAAPDSGAGSPTITLAAPIVPNNLTMPPLLIPNTNNTAISPSVGTGSFASPAQPSSACPPVFEDDETDEAQTTASVSNSSSVYVSSGAGSMMMPPPPPPPARKASQHRPAMGHRHRNSADSISYTKEEDSGETRWVIERRRTAESGEMELLGREIIPGGRI
ncbi:uncharacterized protein B0I36DRAFT_311022 [Microdochium trichocladiopsis]|uniref:AGC-kinase C-terminal domain-containing protein n=1 Tax=Microdochium trichocladiopsis TaxID=1682393 RepID=A0A9P9BWG6_9PEZI|nr:uncharacterized protein B0I36DRAFT_311022 [Microdochium trichocladiopsis]KAH7040575.1 hypothetical protein B0I36DRAFT_311022 [Microdochium trichocladiopsis]